MTATTKTKTCPTWCDWQHHGNDLEDPEAVSHSHVVLGGATGDRFACVALEQADHGMPVIFLDVTDDGQTMSPEEALKVANALRKAARMVGVTR